MFFGTHTSIAGGLDTAPARAWNLCSEVFQIFLHSPRGGISAKISPTVIKNFLGECQRYGFSDYYIHTPYYINLASSNNRIYYGSISALRRDLDIASEIKAHYVMTHLGSAKDLGLKKSLKLVVAGIQKVLADYEGMAQFLIEMSAGAGQIIGDSFEEVTEIIQKVESKRGLKDKIGVCFDTAHAFASGYDLRTASAVKKTLREFDKIIGLKRLKLIHANDSKSELASHVDRHEHIGRGQIGLECFRTLIQDRRFQNTNLILETPGTDRDDRRNVKILKNLRDKNKKYENRSHF